MLVFAGATHWWLALGCIGRAGTGQANEAAPRADVVIAVGTHFSDVDTGGWTLFDIPGRTRLIHLDIDEGELGRVYPAEIALGCDARLGLAALAAAAAGAPAERSAWHAELDAARREWETSVEADRRSDIAPLQYARVCHDTGQVAAEVDPDMPVFFDTGHLLQFGLAGGAHNLVEAVRQLFGEGGRRQVTGKSNAMVTGIGWIPYGTGAQARCSCWKRPEYQSEE